MRRKQKPGSPTLNGKIAKRRVSKEEGSHEPETSNLLCGVDCRDDERSEAGLDEINEILEDISKFNAEGDDERSSKCADSLARSNNGNRTRRSQISMIDMSLDATADPSKVSVYIHAILRIPSFVCGFFEILLTLLQ